MLRQSSRDRLCSSTERRLGWFFCSFLHDAWLIKVPQKNLCHPRGSNWNVKKKTKSRVCDASFSFFLIAEFVFENQNKSILLFNL